MIKKGRENGMFYCHETLNGFYTGLGLRGRITYNTFRKYHNLLVEAQLFTKQGEHHQLANLKTVSERLNIVVENQRLNQLFREKDINEMSFKGVTDWVLEVLFIINFRGQYFKLQPQLKIQDIAHRYLDGTNNKGNDSTTGIKLLAKEAAKNSMSTFDYAKSVLRNDGAYIKTGSRHLAQKFSITPAKANRILNQMQGDGMIKRNVKKKWHNLPVNPASFDYLKSTSNKSVFVPTQHNGWIQVLGSEVMLPMDYRKHPKMFFEQNEISMSQENDSKDRFDKIRTAIGLDRFISNTTIRHTKTTTTIPLALSNDLPTPTIEKIKEAAINTDEIKRKPVETVNPVSTTESNILELIERIKTAIKNERVSLRRNNNILFVETQANQEYLAIGLKKTINGKINNIVYDDMFGRETSSSIPAEYMPEWINEKTLALQ